MNQRTVINNKLIKFVWLFIDLLTITASLLISFCLVYSHEQLTANFIYPIILYIIANSLSFSYFKCYSNLWKYAAEEELISIVIGSVIYVVPLAILINYLGFNLSIWFYLVNTTIVIFFTGGTRLIYRTVLKIINHIKIDKNAKKILIIGAGDAGAIVIDELYNNPSLRKQPIAILDDDENKYGMRIRNVPVVGNTKDIEKIVKAQEIDEIIFAIANIPREDKLRIISNCNKTKCKIKTIPGIYEIIEGKINIKSIRNIDINDLLGRDQIEIEFKDINMYIKNKVVLVTGGGGSIGSELCRQIASFNPKRLIILDNYENNAFEIQQELIRKYKDKIKIDTVIASIREEVRMRKIFEKYVPDIVFHAAAHKHVPLMEENPTEAIKNNVFGTLNIANLAHEFGVLKFILISSDKAVNPTNIMGASKRIAEIIIQNLNKRSDTEFISVRFGNVLGSNGSVIPFFKKQIEEGGPITVTHKDITRYFMTIPEAVTLVIQAGAISNEGDVFVLDMGEPIKIVDLANNLITLSGLEPNVDIKIEFTGLRDGEKMYEELFTEDEVLKDTKYKKIFITEVLGIDEDKLNKNLNMLRYIVENEEDNEEFIEAIIKNIVPNYSRIHN